MEGPRRRAVSRPLDLVMRAVPSKSATHRALVAAALARGTSTIRGPLVADDTQVTLHGLRALGVEIETAVEAWRVHGTGGAIRGGGRLELRDSGTSMRFLLALAARAREPSTLDGSTRLRQRPVRELAQALERLGAAVTIAPDGGGLPATAGGAPLHGGALRVPGGRSSQFASALILLGPTLPGGLDLTLEPPVVSLPYVELTARMGEHFGVVIERRAAARWIVREGPGRARDVLVEGDHSSASYFLAAAVVVGGRVRVVGLDPGSAQPDARCAAILERAGCRVDRGPDWIEIRGERRLRGLDEDLTEAPDLAPTLGMLAAFADGPTRLGGLAHLRDKESDRLETVAGNLRRLGCDVETAGNALVVRPPGPDALRGAALGTASDHRIAMAFAVAALRIDGVTLDDLDCVTKSNPTFWRQYAELVA